MTFEPMVTLIGLVAAFCTTIAFLPQVIKTWQTKSTGDLSFGMYGVFCTGVCLWLLYGILIQDLPIILANTVTLILIVTVLVQIFLYRNREGSASEIRLEQADPPEENVYPEAE